MNESNENRTASSWTSSRQLADLVDVSCVTRVASARLNTLLINPLQRHITTGETGSYSLLIYYSVNVRITEWRSVGFGHLLDGSCYHISIFERPQLLVCSLGRS
jgi:hypothetical protein